jgi:hypothetical protein
MSICFKFEGYRVIYAPSGGNIPRVTTPVLGCGGVATPGVMQ